MSDEGKKGKPKKSEVIELRGKELVDRVKQLIEEGNIRKLIVRKETGEKLIEIPMTAGVVAGGVLALMAPVLAGLGAMAAFMAHLKLEIIRTDDETSE